MQQAAAEKSDHDILADLNQNYVRSALESDVKWYSENLSEDFYITAPDGVLLNAMPFSSASQIRIPGPLPNPSTS